MKKIFCLVASITLLANIEAQQTVKKSLEDFNAIDVNSVARVTLIQSDSNYIVLESKDPVMKSPKVEVHNGVLQITGAPFRGTMDVYVKNLTSIKASDAVRITCKDTLKTSNLRIHASDASRIDVLVRAKTVWAKANDAGNVTISGSTDSLEVKASDASRINAEGLKATSARAFSTDGSNVSVWAVNAIHAKATDGSRIDVKGSPAQITTSASDGGSVKMDDSGVETTKENSSLDDMHSYEWHDHKDSAKRHKTINVDADGFIGMGFITGGYRGAEVKYGTSREFMIGGGKAFKILKWNAVGFDIYYKSTDFYLAQNSNKSFPDSIQHKAQKISFQNFGGLVYDRFYFGKHIFLDGGFYGDWTFHSKLITWDDNIPNVGSSKTILKNLSFVNADNYGLTFRFGSIRGLSLYFNYRLSQYFKNPAAPAPAYPQLPVYVIGVNLNSF